MIQAVWGFVVGVFALTKSLPALVQIAWLILKWIKDEYDASQRAAVAKELKEAIKEGVKTYDNTRLMKLIDPSAEPFPRRQG